MLREKIIFRKQRARDSAAKDATGMHREVIIAYVYYPERFDRQIDRDGPYGLRTYVFHRAREMICTPHAAMQFAIEDAC